MSRHYWPTEPGWYLVECCDGSVERLRLHPSGYWLCVGSAPTTETLQDNGYLGVLKPFSEEAERVAFEAEYRNRWPKDGVIQRDKNGAYIHAYASIAFEWWLLAKRHERGL